MNQLDHFVAEAVLGVDTLWGGDVMCASGTGRFIADSWFSDEPLPRAYTHPAADHLRKSGGGVSAKNLDRVQADIYLRDLNLAVAIAGIRTEAQSTDPLRCAYLTGLSDSLQVMLDLALEVLGKGDPVPYERAVAASTGKPPEPSRPESRRDRVADLLAQTGIPSPTTAAF